MNKVVISLFSVLLSLFTKAQTYIPLPESDAEWQTHQSNWDPGTNTGSFWFDCTHTSGDTLLNGIKYTKLIRYRDHIASTASYRGAFRNDTTQRTVYYMPVNSTSEILLYDFRLTTGDSIRFYNGSKYSVTKVSIETIAGKQRKVIEIPSMMFFSNDASSYKIIEGIGANTGLFFDLNTNPELPVQSVNGGTCFINNGGTWELLNHQSCSFYTSIARASATNNHLLIYPNPAYKYLTIKLSGLQEAPYQLELVNLLGEKILVQNLMNNQANDIMLPEHLPNTICFYRIISNTTVIEQGKLMLQ